MKLTENQIQELYVFTRKHYVEWYDLQTELVDHLANDIETLREQNPETSFEKALDLTFKKFGVFGFADVIAKRQKALRRKYMNMSIQYLNEFFRLPKIILTVLMTLSMFKIMIGNSIESTFYIFRIICLCLAILVFFHKIKLRIMKKQTGIRWMFEEYLHKADISFFIIITLSHLTALGLFNFLEGVSKSWVIFGVAFLTTLFSIITYFDVVVFPRKVQGYLSQNFPEYIIPNKIL